MTADACGEACDGLDDVGVEEIILEIQELV